MRAKRITFDKTGQFRNYQTGEYNIVDTGFDDYDLSDVYVEYRHKPPKNKAKPSEENDTWK